MAMVSFGHAVHHQEAKKKPLQTQKKTNHKSNYEYSYNAPTAGDRVCHRELARQSDHNP